jgi:hypothetical protein
MTLQLKALAAAGAVLLGGGLFLIAMGNILFPGYGAPVLEAFASIYPGYHGPDGVGSAFVVGLYASLDGAVAGAVLGLVYNAVVRAGTPRGERFTG